MASLPFGGGHRLAEKKAGGRAPVSYLGLSRCSDYFHCFGSDCNSRPGFSSPEYIGNRNSDRPYRRAGLFFVAPAGCQFSLDGNGAVFAGNTECQSVLPAELHSAARTTVIALVSQRVTNPPGAQASGPCSSRNLHAETGITDAVYNYSVRSATKGLTRVARGAGTKHDAAATAVKSPATAL